MYRTAAMQENGGEIWRRGCNIKKRLNSAEHILADGFRATLLCIQSLHTPYLLPPVNPVMTVSSSAVPNRGMRTWQCRPTLLSLTCLLSPSLPPSSPCPLHKQLPQEDTQHKETHLGQQRSSPSAVLLLPLVTKAKRHSRHLFTIQQCM